MERNSIRVTLFYQDSKTLLKIVKNFEERKEEDDLFKIIKTKLNIQQNIRKFLKSNSAEITSKEDLEDGNKLVVEAQESENLISDDSKSTVYHLKKEFQSVQSRLKISSSSGKN